MCCGISLQENCPNAAFQISEDKGLQKTAANTHPTFIRDILNAAVGRKFNEETKDDLVFVYLLTDETEMSIENPRDDRNVQCSPLSLSERIVFLSVLSDLEFVERQTRLYCPRNATSVSQNAAQFRPGHWCWCAPGGEVSWTYHPCNYPLAGAVDAPVNGMTSLFFLFVDSSRPIVKSDEQSIQERGRVRTGHFFQW